MSRVRVVRSGGASTLVSGALFAAEVVRRLLVLLVFLVVGSVMGRPASHVMCWPRVGSGAA